MRILMVTPGYYPIKGGTETIVRNLSIELNKRGMHTDVMTFNMDQKWKPKWQGKTESSDGITIFKIPALNWFPIEHSDRITLGINLIPGRFTNTLKDYDIVHFHEFELSFPLFSFSFRKPKIIHFHGIDVNFLRRYHLSRFLLKHLPNFYISISRQMEKDLLALGILRNKVMYLPNGIDTNLFTPNSHKEDNLLLFVGRITAGKGLHVLLKSLRYLKNSVRLVIIGPADWDAQYYLDMLKSIKKENKKGKHEIRYLGPLEQADIIKWYQKASIFILPSFKEGFPVTIIEALSCETPVIATSVGGIPEIIKDYKNGILVPLNDSINLSKAIQFLLDNKQIRTSFGRAGRRLAKNYSLETIVLKLCKIYEQIVSSFSNTIMRC